MLADAMLRSLRPPRSGRVVLRDAGGVGLELRLLATGVAAWSVRGTLPAGRRIRATLGAYPAIGLAEARRLALETLGRIAQGHDPVAGKRAARATREAAAAGGPDLEP